MCRDFVSCGDTYSCGQLSLGFSCGTLRVQEGMGGGGGRDLETQKVHCRTLRRLLYMLLLRHRCNASIIFILTVPTLVINTAGTGYIWSLGPHTHSKPHPPPGCLSAVFLVYCKELSHTNPIQSVLKHVHGPLKPFSSIVLRGAIRTNY